MYYEETAKQCGVCEELKDLEAFHRTRKGKYGRHSICKDCRSATRTDFKNLPSADEKLDRITVTDMMRFYDNCVFNPETGCLDWIGAKNANGYGSMWKQGRVASHRFAYAAAFPESWDPSMQVHHLCGNRGCCLSTHLELIPPGVHQRHHAELRKSAREKLDSFGKSRSRKTTYGVKKVVKH